MTPETVFLHYNARPKLEAVFIKSRSKDIICLNKSHAAGLIGAGFVFEAVGFGFKEKFPGKPNRGCEILINLDA